MRGMLMKDWYLLVHYCKSVLLVAIIFIGASTMNRGNVFFLFLLCILIGMLPMTLLADDERSGWDTYCQAFPYTREMVVSEKYLLGLVLSVGMAVILWGVQWVMFRAQPLVLFASLVFSLIPPAIVLPLAFRFGTEKARFFYYIVVGAMAGVGAVILSRGEAAELPSLAVVETSLVWLALPALAAALTLYLLSWALSIHWYKRKEF